MGVVVDQYFVFWHSFSFFEVDSLGGKVVNEHRTHLSLQRRRHSISNERTATQLTRIAAGNLDVN
jgi:hypothetical protein